MDVPVKVSGHEESFGTIMEPLLIKDFGCGKRVGVGNRGARNWSGERGRHGGAGFVIDMKLGK